MIHVDDLLFFFFSWFLFAAAGLSLLPHRAGIQDDEIQQGKSKKESPSMIFGSTIFFSHDFQNST